KELVIRITIVSDHARMSIGRRTQLGIYGGNGARRNRAGGRRPGNGNIYLQEVVQGSGVGAFSGVQAPWKNAQALQDRPLSKVHVPHIWPDGNSTISKTYPCASQ